MSEFNNLVSMLNDKNDIILSQQAKIDELEFKLSSIVNNFDNSCKTISIHQKFLDDADVANKFLTDKIDELQARVDSLTNINESLVAYKNQLLDDIEEKGNKDETWKMEYLRHPDTLHSWKSFTIAGLIPILGWLYILYSMYEAVKIYLKHRGVTK